MHIFYCRNLYNKSFRVESLDSYDSQQIKANISLVRYSLQNYIIAVDINVHYSGLYSLFVQGTAGKQLCSLLMLSPWLNNNFVLFGEIGYLEVTTPYC